MSNYTKSTNFATKDNLPTGDPLKIVKGTEIDTEFNNISTAIATKTDNSAAAITGGSITGITDLAIADGGTGASTATAAINNLLPSQTSNANKYLQTDGTNVSWDAVSLSTSDITGTLPVANGGTGLTSLGTGITTFLGTPSSANLASAVTDETGSGALVFANSPTLVTPALGTPSSATLTYATGLPLSTGITGLGTGVATALAINTPNTGAIVVNGGALGTPSSGTVTNLTGTASININGMVGSSTQYSGAFTSLSASSALTLSAGTVDGVAYLNSSKELTTGSVLSFSGVHLTSNRNKDTTYSATDYTTYPNGFILQNSATPATGIFNSIYFKNNANMQNVFGVVQNSSGYGDFVWSGYSGSYAEWMRLTSSGLTLTSNPTLSGGTANGVTYLNGSKVLTSGSTFVFDSSDRLIVGAGSATVGHRMEVVPTGAGGAIAIRGLASNAVGIISWHANAAATEYARISSDNTSSLIFGTGSSGSEGMRLTSTGLGLGTSSPTAVGSYRILDINGTSGGYIGLFVAGTKKGAVYAGSGGLGLEAIGANPISFYTNNALQATIDSSGNLGLGVAPSAWDSIFKVIDVGTTASFAGSSGGANLFNNAWYNGSSYIYKTTAGAARYLQSVNEHLWFNAPSGTAGTNISFTQAMTLSADGKLGIGETSPAQTLVLKNTSSAPYLSLIAGSSSAMGVLMGTAGNTVDGQILYSNSTQAMVFVTASAERARIDSSGNLLVGQTSQIFSGKFCISSPLASTNSIALQNTSTQGAGQSFMYMANSAGNKAGSIDHSGTTTVAYTTSSDYRLKENVQPMVGALAKIEALNPVTYTWKEDGTSSQGFIAHELQAVVPECVVGEKDAMDADGNPQYQGIDTSFLVATLTAAIQEQQAIIESLKARLDAANL